MSDAPFVLRNYVPFLEAAEEGDVLLTGLGLGCLVRGLLARPLVRSVTVVELHADVLELIGPYYRRPGVELVHADALDWEPPRAGAGTWRCWTSSTTASSSRACLDHYGHGSTRSWPNPAEIPDQPAGPDLEHLISRAPGGRGLTANRAPPGAVRRRSAHGGGRAALLEPGAQEHRRRPAQHGEGLVVVQPAHVLHDDDRVDPERRGRGRPAGVAVARRRGP